MRGGGFPQNLPSGSPRHPPSSIPTHDPPRISFRSSERWDESGTSVNSEMINATNIISSMGAQCLFVCTTQTRFRKYACWPADSFRADWLFCQIDLNCSFEHILWYLGSVAHDMSWHLSDTSLVDPSKNFHSAVVNEPGKNQVWGLSRSGVSVSTTMKKTANAISSVPILLSISR